MPPAGSTTSSHSCPACTAGILIPQSASLMRMPCKHGPCWLTFHAWSLWHEPLHTTPVCVCVLHLRTWQDQAERCHTSWQAPRSWLHPAWLDPDTVRLLSLQLRAESHMPFGCCFRMIPQETCGIPHISVDITHHSLKNVMIGSCRTTAARKGVGPPSLLHQESHSPAHW